MKQIYATITLLLFSLIFGHILHAQVTLKGKVRDAETGDDLIGASVVPTNAQGGALTDYEGAFVLKVEKLPVTIKISYTGYEPQELNVTDLAQKIDIRLSTASIVMEEAVVVGQRIDDKQKAAPLTVENMDALAIKQTASVNFYNGLGNLKGVDLTTASLGFTIINTRGFNSTSPVRSLQIIDGVDNQAPGLNFSLGNFLGSSDLDVVKVDLIQGASSAFYGPNAFNGVISMETKNPFVHKGLSASIKSGERNLWEGAIRWADAIKNKKGDEVFAYKLNFFHLRANDWEANNYDPVTGTESGGQFYTTAQNPGRYDAVNIYGDEYVARFDGSANPAWNSGRAGLNIYHRTGYREVDLVDYNTRNTKANAALHFRTNPAKGFESPELILSSSFGAGTTVYQGDNRFSLRDILFFQNRIEFRKKDKFFLRAYSTNEDAGNSYDPYFTALRMQQLTKDNQRWASDYEKWWTSPALGNVYFGKMEEEWGFPTPSSNTPTQAELAAIDAWMLAYRDSLANMHSLAEAYANQAHNLPGQKVAYDFYEPGTARFDSLFNDITSRKSTQGGTKFFDQSALYHVHGEYRFTPKWLNYWLVGGNVRFYRPVSEGTIFSDTITYERDANNAIIDSFYRKITNYEFGMYTGVEKSWGDWKFNGTVRVDKNQNFKWLATPAVSAVWNPRENNYLRASFSSAIRNPTLTDQYLFLNVGRATLLGNITGYKDLITLESLRDYLAVPFPTQSLLKRFDVAPIQPEKVKTFELGYRTTLFKKLYVDAGYYYSIYDNFIGYNIGIAAEIDPFFGLDYQSIKAYRVAANSTSTVTTQGLALGMNYYFGDYYMVQGNYSWNRLNSAVDDPIIPAFNTPEHKYNVGLSGRDLPLSKKNKKIVWGFNVVYKWIEGFTFEGSPQFTGFIPTYDMLDAQLNLNVPVKDAGLTFKVGAANILDNRRYQTYGGPLIGRMAYASLVYEWKKK
ncbi:MAG TPA: TonB-dependent receptor [Saprospiraceae bacterium]|nr:TonB-dependent receptor [Saprospiraceae bacterium]